MLSYCFEHWTHYQNGSWNIRSPSPTKPYNRFQPLLSLTTKLIPIQTSYSILYNIYFYINFRIKNMKYIFLLLMLQGQRMKNYTLQCETLSLSDKLRKKTEWKLSINLLLSSFKFLNILVCLFISFQSWTRHFLAQVDKGILAIHIYFTANLKKNPFLYSAKVYIAFSIVCNNVSLFLQFKVFY